MAAVVAAAEEVMMVYLLNGAVADIQLAVDALALDVANNFCDTRVQAESLSTSFGYFDFRVSASFSPLRQL